MNMDANNNQDIIINMDIAKYIGETTEYDKKQEVERRKVKSWLKSVSAFANGGDGCLLFGIADDISGKEFKMIIPCVIITLVDGNGVQFPGGTIKVTTEARPSMENTLWEGEFSVTWGTPFDALKETFLSKVKAGTILRVYVDGKGQGTAATAWWNNILTGKGDPERGDIMVDGPAKWEFELTDLSIQLLTEQDGFLLVGDGYTVKKSCASHEVPSRPLQEPNPETEELS